jgi:hypothetical protein
MFTVWKWPNRTPRLRALTVCHQVHKHCPACIQLIHKADECLLTGERANLQSQAIQYFNLLSKEKRNVACALLPEFV